MQQLSSERLAEVSEVKRAMFQKLLSNMNNPRIFLYVAYILRFFSGSAVPGES
jgi:hypothetical protein